MDKRIGELDRVREVLRQEVSELPFKMVMAIDRVAEDEKLGFNGAGELLREALRDKITEYE